MLATGSRFASTPPHRPARSRRCPGGTRWRRRRPTRRGGRPPCRTGSRRRRPACRNGPARRRRAEPAAGPRSRWRRRRPSGPAAGRAAPPLPWWRRRRRRRRGRIRKVLGIEHHFETLPAVAGALDSGPAADGARGIECRPRADRRSARRSPLARQRFPSSLPDRGCGRSTRDPNNRAVLGDRRPPASVTPVSKDPSTARGSRLVP